MPLGIPGEQGKLVLSLVARNLPGFEGKRTTGQGAAKRMQCAEASMHRMYALTWLLGRGRPSALVPLCGDARLRPSLRTTAHTAPLTLLRPPHVIKRLQRIC